MVNVEDIRSKYCTSPLTDIKVEKLKKIIKKYPELCEECTRNCLVSKKYNFI